MVLDSGRFLMSEVPLYSGPGGVAAAVYERGTVGGAPS